MLNTKLDSLLSKLESCTVNANTNDNHIKLLREIDSFKEAINISEELISEIKETESKKMIFRSRTKWAEEGEKSSKYFLNLIKSNQNKTIISNINVNNKTFHKQEEIKTKIKDFYQNLYSKKEPTQTHHTFFSNLPQLSQSDQDMLETDLSINEIYLALMTCKESAPGPDGIPYKVYKDFWDILGPEILAVWQLSERTKKLALSQRHSVITLIEKKYV